MTIDHMASLNPKRGIGGGLVTWLPDWGASVKEVSITPLAEHGVPSANTGALVSLPPVTPTPPSTVRGLIAGRI